jgi:hypothetical protein
MHNFKKRFRSSASPCASGVSVAFRTRRLMQATDAGVNDDRRSAISICTIERLVADGFLHEPLPFGFPWREGITIRMCMSAAGVTMVRGSLCVPPALGASPRFASGNPIR